METNRNNSGLEAGSTGYNPGRDSGQDVWNQGRTTPSDTGPGRGAEGGGGAGGAGGAGGVLNKPVQAAKQYVRQGRDVAKDIGRDVSEQARDIAQELKGTADEVIGQQREKVTGRVGGIANALHRVSDELRQDQDAAPVARYTDYIAEKLDDAAQMLQNKEPRDLIRGIENFARREPALFLGGCLLAGVVISRFLKASSRHDDTYRGADEESWERRPDSMGNYGPSGPIDENPPRGPLDRSGMGGGSAAPFDVTPRMPETPPEMGGGV